MHEVLQQYYGVMLNHTRNQIITQSWDMAQEKVCSCDMQVNSVDTVSWLKFKGTFALDRILILSAMMLLVEEFTVCTKSKSSISMDSLEIFGLTA